MKRFWPLLFLTLLFVALATHPVPRPIPLTTHGPWIVPTPVEIAPVPAPTPSPAPTAEAPEERQEEAMKRSAVGAAIHWLALHQNEDGSWGDVPVTVGGRTIGRTGVTSLALLTLLGAGYSQLSRDEYDGEKTLGQVVKKGLKWLLQDQIENGTFQSGVDAGFDQALATLGLTEAYGMTAAAPLKEPAEKAVQALVRMQGTDGSWGGPEQTAWAIQAMFSAELSEVPVPREVYEPALNYVNRTPHPSNILSRLLLTRRASPADAEDAALLAANLPQGDPGDLSGLLHATNGLFHYDGSDGPLWKKWNEPMKNAIVPSQLKDGSLPGGTMSHTVVRTSLGGLALEVYYRYSNIIGMAK